jgi:hypothetical protein
MDSISKPSPQQQTPASTSSNARTRLSAHKGPRTIDDASRRRRIQRQLENLEKDNFHEDPHAAVIYFLKINFILYSSLLWY